VAPPRRATGGMAVLLEIAVLLALANEPPTLRRGAVRAGGPHDVAGVRVRSSARSERPKARRFQLRNAGNRGARAAVSGRRADRDAAASDLSDLLSGVGNASSPEASALSSQRFIHAN
jgi:hypothetical protein